MAAPTKEGKVDLLHPELLSKEGLIFILNQRYITGGQKRLEELDMQDLLDLYYQHVLPRPQRQPRLNRRGKIISKSMSSRKRISAPSNDDGESSPKKQSKVDVDGHSRGLINHFNSSSSPRDRLKPPPSCVNADLKTIKLNSGKNSVPGASNSVTLNKGIDVDGKRKVADSHGTNMQKGGPSPNKKFSQISWP